MPYVLHFQAQIEWPGPLTNSGIFFSIPVLVSQRPGNFSGKWLNLFLPSQRSGSHHLPQQWIFYFSFSPAGALHFHLMLCLGLVEYTHRSVFPEWLLDCRKNTVPNIPMTILSEPALSLTLMVRKECLLSFTSAFKVLPIPAQGTSICTAGLRSVAPRGSPVPYC